MALAERKIRIPVSAGAWFLILVFLFARAGAVCSSEERGFPVDGNRSSSPVHIVSDKMEAETREKWIEFVGNVIATDEDAVVKADRLKVYYISSAGPEADSIKKIVAHGNVRITSNTKKATADHAVYTADDHILVLTGDSTLLSEKNVIRGDKITLFLDENRSLVESDSGKQVEAEFYPDKKGGLIE